MENGSEHKGQNYNEFASSETEDASFLSKLFFQRGQNQLKRKKIALRSLGNGEEKYLRKLMRINILEN